MLLLFTNVLHFFSAQIFAISSNACCAFSAHITFAPRFVIFASKLSSILSRFSIAFHFIFFAFSLARFTLLNCSFPFGTTALYLPILKLILRRWSLSAVFTVLFSIKDCECSDMFTNITFSLSLIVFVYRFKVTKWHLTINYNTQTTTITIFLSQNSFLSMLQPSLHNILHHSPAFSLFSLFLVAVIYLL